MKFRNMVVLILLSVFATLTLISCNYILENTKQKNEIINEKQSRVYIHKQEAKLLLNASRNNLDILELCEDLKSVDTQNSIGHLTERLEKTHFEISKNYNELAEKKLISIPSYENINNVNKLELKNIDIDSFIQNKLKLILNKTDTQIQLLNALGKTTDNIEFKVLAVTDTHKLKSNINKIETTLNKLNQ
ncbi:hypothetical protein [Confluentibacter sediminis]|uniref:hypothetical protein n=1 Tax=Confluentibacter sediminis TaxID=2219045 RepID=UPI000DABC0BF|nr:hypothetical protein [Confluentibacter sediminis]